MFIILEGILIKLDDISSYGFVKENNNELNHLMVVASNVYLKLYLDEDEDFIYDIVTSLDSQLKMKNVLNKINKELDTLR